MATVQAGSSRDGLPTVPFALTERLADVGEDRATVRANSFKRHGIRRSSGTSYK